MNKRKEELIEALEKVISATTEFSAIIEQDHWFANETAPSDMVEVDELIHTLIHWRDNMKE